MKGSPIEGLYYKDGKPISIDIRDGKIDRISRPTSIAGTHGDAWIVAPGYIDIQVNGYASVDFSSQELNLERVGALTRALWKEGVTTYLPTVITLPLDRAKHNFRILAEALHDPDIGVSIPGFHMEGPFISAEDGYRGAHHEEWTRSPDWDEFKEVLEASGEKILMVTLAPELEGALDFIDQCVGRGIVVALGHHHAPANLITAAADRGATISTHLGNGCANSINRHDNILWPQLAEDRLAATLIVDGLHLPREEVQVFYKVKGPDQLILVSDATCFAGMPPGTYDWNERRVEVTPEGRIINLGEDNLAGASFPVHTGISNIMQFTGCGLTEAVDMASANPARHLGLSDRGEIEPGKRADVVLFQVGKEGIRIRKTIVAGRIVYSSKQ